ncbi:MAG: hypothetical protein ACSLFA_28320 [Mycobacterium sp.]
MTAGTTVSALTVADEVSGRFAGAAALEDRLRAVMPIGGPGSAGTSAAAGLRAEPPVEKSDPAVLGVRAVRAPSAVLADGRLDSLDDSPGMLPRAALCSDRRPLSPRDSLLDWPPRACSPPRRSELSRRSE